MSLNVVTGSTGFVGRHIVSKLLKTGEHVRVLVRPESNLRNLAGLNVDIARGDLRDIDSLRKALAGCHRLYHAAAEYTLWVRNPETLYQSNVEGTRNILQAAKDEGVERIVYTSTVGALATSRDGIPSQEETPVGLGDMISHYKKSKYLAQQEALKFAREGLPVIIVNPSTPIGSHDIKPTPTGQMIVDFLRGKMIGYLETGLNLIDVEDVAEGHLLAADKGRIGEMYILGHQNLYLKDIFAMISRLSGVAMPRFKMPYHVALGLGYINTVFSNYITHRPPVIPVDGVKMTRKLMFFDSSKAVRELGLPQHSVEEALAKAIAWFRENGYIKV
ncbi:MAG: NAD-dependent epimerase/dehydratase family protein [Chlamydiota bacterium]|nr:NAD-dependent epimerase/dehydratase family protein [Chlamydiota bacterium]